jgi:hypothetical protein
MAITGNSAGPKKTARDKEIHATLDGKVHVVRAGEAVFLPRGIPHQLRNASELPSRYSVLCIPSGLGDFVAEAGRVVAEGEAAAPPTPSEIQSMKEGAPRFGIRLLPGFREDPRSREHSAV